MSQNEQTFLFYTLRNQCAEDNQDDWHIDLIAAPPFHHYFFLLAGINGVIQIDEQKVLKMQLADLCFSENTIKRWKIPTASSHTTAVEPEEESYESDFEDAEDERNSNTVAGSTPAVQQLLGATQKGPSAPLRGSGVEVPETSDHNAGLQEPSGGSATLRQGITAAGEGGAAEACWPSLDEVGLSVGLPKAGFGFATGFVPAEVAIPVQSRIPPKASSIDVESLSTGVAPPDAVGRRLTALAGHGGGELLVKPPSFTFSPPIPKTKSTHRDVMVETQSCSATSKIRLHEALTNRAIFLNRELEGQLGSEVLKEACDVLRAALHACMSQRGAADNGDVEWSDGGLREALSGVLSPVHLELAPLVDELVLLQDRFYA